MRRVHHILLSLFFGAVFPLCVYSQSEHYSVLCTLAKDVKKPPASEVKIKFNVVLRDRKVSNIKTSSATGPVRMMILRDISGSTNGTNEQKLSLEAIKDLVALSSAADQFALIDFNDKSQTRIDLQNATLFSKQLDDSKLEIPPVPKGRTAIFDTIYTAATYLQKNPQEGDTILVITDGDDNASKIGHTRLKEYLLSSKIRLYLFVLSTPANTKDSDSRVELADLMIDTGGRLTGVAQKSGLIVPIYDASPKSLDIIRSRVAGLQSLIKKAHRVEFDLDSPLTKRASLDVSILDEDGKAAEGLQLVCPRYIYPK